MTNFASIRLETQADHEAVARVHREAFGKDYEAGIVERGRRSPDHLPDLSLVAEGEGEIVGHILLSRGDLSGRPALALGPIGVLPDRQRQGIGAALVEEALARARARGENVVVLIGHPEYYPRFGFTPASRLGISVRSDVPDAVLMALELRPGGAGGGGTFTYSSAFDAPVD